MLALTPFNYDMGFVLKAFLNRLIQCSDPFLIFIGLGLKIGDPGYSNY